MINTNIFEVDLQLTIEKEFDKKQIKHKTKLLGWKEDSYMILEVPTINGMLLNWKSGTSCVVKFINKGSVYRFQTTVVKLLHNPIPVIFVKYPKAIDNATTRKHDRIQTYLICDTFPLDENLEIKTFDFIDKESFEKSAVLLDFSIEGGLVEIKSNLVSLSVGERVSLSFTMPNNIAIDKLVTEIRNIRIESGRKLMGLRFLELNQEPFDHIKDFFEVYTDSKNDY